MGKSLYTDAQGFAFCPILLSYQSNMFYCKSKLYIIACYIVYDVWPIFTISDAKHVPKTYACGFINHICRRLSLWHYCISLTKIFYCYMVKISFSVNLHAVLKSVEYCLTFDLRTDGKPINGLVCWFISYKWLMSASSCTLKSLGILLQWEEAIAPHWDTPSHFLMRVLWHIHILYSMFFLFSS